MTEAAAERPPEPGNEADPSPSGTAAPHRRRRRRRRGKGGGAAAQQPANGAAAAPKEAPAQPPHRVLPDSLQAAVFRHTTDPVLARGRGYVKRKRVTEVRVSAGRVRAKVLGSGSARYRVELTSPQRPAPAVVTKIRWTCDCPYASEHRRGTCKHVVAVAIVAAKRLERPDALARWLGQPAVNAAEAEPAEFDALADRMLAAFTAEPVDVDTVLDRAYTIAPPPFEIHA